MLPDRGCVVRLGGMNEKKWRLIDDNVVVSLIYDFEVKEWSNAIMEKGTCANSKAITRSIQ